MINSIRDLEKKEILINLDDMKSANIFSFFVAEAKNTLKLTKSLEVLQDTPLIEILQSFMESNKRFNATVQYLPENFKQKIFGFLVFSIDLDPLTSFLSIELILPSTEKP